MKLKSLPAVMRALDSVLVSRSKIATFAGKTFDGKRDLYTALGYKRALSYSDFYDRYRRGGIAGRIVDIPASATWRNSPDIKDNTSVDETDFDKTWKELVDRLRVFPFMERADRLAGIGHYGALLIGAPGSLETPLPPSMTPKDIIFLSPFSEEDAEVKDLDNDTTSPRFGRPATYSLRVNSSVVGSSRDTRATQPTIVHHSRIIHVAEGLGQDEIFGIPRLLRIWNYLDDLDKIIGGSAEAIWRTVDRGIQFDLDKDAFLDPADEEDFADEIEDYMHGLKRWIKTQGITANVLGSDTPNPSGVFGVVGSLIAGTTGIPMRVLFGSERGQLASTQDERNFNARIKERQKSYAEPMMLRPLVDMLIDRKVLPEPAEGYSITWPDLSTLTRREQADVAARVAQSIRSISTQGAQNSPTRVITGDEFRKEYLGLGPMPKEDKDEEEPSKDEPDPEKEDEETDAGKEEEGNGPTSAALHRIG